jgi:hypothetical protein
VLRVGGRHRPDGRRGVAVAVPAAVQGEAPERRPRLGPLIVVDDEDSRTLSCLNGSRRTTASARYATDALMCAGGVNRDGRDTSLGRSRVEQP